MENNCVGIDIAKLTFVAAMKVAEKYKVKSFPNSEDGYKSFIEWLKELSVEKCHCCMEATGKYGNELALYLHNNNQVV